MDESSDTEDPEKKAKEDLDKYRIEIKEKETLFQLAVVEIAGKRGKWTEHVF